MLIDMISLIRLLAKLGYVGVITKLHNITNSDFIVLDVMFGNIIYRLFQTLFMRLRTLIYLLEILQLISPF